MADLYFKEECSQKGWAYCSLQSVHNDGSSRIKDDNVVTFTIGAKKVNIKIMQQLIPEIMATCQPVASKDGTQSFAFDYLACKIGRDIAHNAQVVANPTALSWIHIKTSGVIFSDRQLDALSRIQLSLTVFSIRDILATPRNLELKWDTRSGTKWMDLIDELKEQEEYDDEYF